MNCWSGSAENARSTARDPDVSQPMGSTGIVRFRSPVRSKTWIRWFGAVAGVHQAVAANHHAVRMPAAPLAELAGSVARRTPLPQVVAVAVKHDDTVVAVAVGNVDRPRFAGDRIGIRVDRKVRRRVQEGMALVEPDLTARRIGGVHDTRPSVRVRLSVTDALAADLQQQLPAVVRPLLHDPILVAGQPDIVLVVRETTVRGRGQDRGSADRCQGGITPTTDQRSVTSKICTGSAGIEVRPALPLSPPVPIDSNARFTVMMWSCESTHTEPTSPVIRSCCTPSVSSIVGSGFGHNGATRYRWGSPGRSAPAGLGGALSSGSGLSHARAGQ